MKLITIHLPVRMESEEEVEKAAEQLSRLLPRPYFVNKRGYWLDLTVRASEDALGIDLFEGSSVKAAIEKFIEKITQYLSKTERNNQHG